MKSFRYTIFSGIVAIVIFAGLAIFLTQRYLDKTISLNLPSFPSGSYELKKDITYCSPNGLAQKLDLYLPDSKSSHPLVIYIHGGSWLGGDKSVDASSKYLSVLAKSGYAVASINYRLMPEYVFPAPIQDSKCAIRFLRENHSKYNINPGKIGLLGESAGGYIAAFDAATGDNSAYRTNEYATQSDKVQAVVDLAGPSDFTVNYPSSQAATVYAFTHGSTLTQASPITYITSSSPPFLIIHGNDDTTVPIDQSYRLNSKLKSKNVKSSLIAVKGAGHSLDGSTVTQPTAIELGQDILSFYQQELKK